MNLQNHTKTYKFVTKNSNIFLLFFIDTILLKNDKINLISNQIISYNQKDIYLQQIKRKRSGCYEKLYKAIRPIFFFSFSFS
ncbi:hypothetical protein CN896_18135 [Bacillus thuringiensis]|nr:hypothetical protein CN896_18135 [Bacillus thuringiensis]PGH96782.1 hypothetical protein CN898_16005 [Bacillus thuringiensis]PGT58751.1 hypothetical protein COD16_19640 [Bacillus thuringiensis]